VRDLDDDVSVLVRKGVEVVQDELGRHVGYLVRGAVPHKRELKLGAHFGILLRNIKLRSQGLRAAVRYGQNRLREEAAQVSVADNADFRPGHFWSSVSPGE